MADDLARIEQRLKALERQNRVLRWLFAFALVAAAASPFVVAAQQSTAGQVIQARTFEVVRDGKVVASLGSSKFGGSLDISDLQGKTVGYFDSTAERSGVLMINSGDEQPAVSLSANAIGEGMIQLRPSYANKALGRTYDTEVELRAGVTGGRLYLRSQGKTGVVLDSDYRARGGRVVTLDAAGKATSAAPQ